MRVVAALGGNALLRRGQPLTAENQRENVVRACAALAPIAREHELVISHGNGPPVGLLALQGAAYRKVETYPLDVLDAQTEGMIGYLIMQELGNVLPYEKSITTLLTMIEVDAHDPAFQEPKRIFGLQPVEWLLEHGSVVICAGGGGIPTIYSDELAPAGKRLTGVDAVIDKDLASATLAADLRADALLILTDVDAVYSDWGTPHQNAIRSVSTAGLASAHFAEGSMAPKVRAARRFADRGAGFATIGAIDDAAGMLAGTAGTCAMPTEGMFWARGRFSSKLTA